ncbi:unnamed protein product [Paramecium sonneborni]|uniref:Uncharacterized protein n=1 Tax=Paramecium sonneborni TaxID=65129 RepID=A0A8S1LCU3_9CILI|nr:unnamed protein product [Paramecium sonneborni]
MDDNYFTNMDSSRVLNFFAQSQNLKFFQIQKINEEINCYKEEIFRYSNMVNNFVHQLRMLIPEDNIKLKNKSIKHKWIKLFVDQNRMTYWIHQDYCTYLIYHKISLPQIKKDLNQQYNIREAFEDIVTEYIFEINQKFFEFMLQVNPYSQDTIQFKFDNLGFYQMIEYLYDIDDILTEEELCKILFHIKKTMDNLIENENQKVIQIIQKQYKDFLENTAIDPCSYPQDFSYNDFGDGLETVQLISKQDNIQAIDESQNLDILENGIYSFQHKKTIIILEIFNNQKNAYIINEFEYYQITSNIIEKLQKFTINRIKTIKLSIKEAYILIKMLKKKKQFEKYKNQTLQIYKKSEFEEINRELSNQTEQFQQIQQKILQFVTKITPQSKNYKDIYSLNFVELLKKQVNFQIIPSKEFDYDLKKIEFQEQILAEVLVDKQQNTLGVVVYINKQQILVLLKNTQDIKNHDNKLDEEEFRIHCQMSNKFENSKRTLLIQTNVKEIKPGVAQFYVSLLLHKQENNLCKHIKDFLELKSNVWMVLLNLLV